MFFRQWLSVAVLVAAPASCFAVEIHSSHDRSADFASLKTYAWVPHEMEDPATSSIDQEFVQSRVHEAVDAELTAKGYKKLSSGRPDFWIDWGAMIGSKLRVSTETPMHDAALTGLQSSVSVGAAPQVYASDVDEGTLILRFVNPRTSRVIWRATAEEVVNVSWGKRKKTAKIKKAVSKMLRLFPPK
ncbi:MAG: DUF4136 domain-containing protein [Acidiferrobacterales bacterium]